MKILNVVGTRPNLVKMAAIVQAMARSNDIEQKLIHTGQHYDQELSDLFFKELGIPSPDINLEVGSASNIQQVAEIMKRFEKVLEDEKPDAVLVVGDVNSTIACGFPTVQSGIKLIHVEAGLRSFDLSMPEEINRTLTDSISDLLFVTEKSGLENLKEEGIPDEKVFFVGNVMIDTLNNNLQKAKESKILKALGIDKNYLLLTLHRPSNVDDPEKLQALLQAFQKIPSSLEILFPVHPRTSTNFKKFGLKEEDFPHIKMVPPLGYLDFLHLMSNAKIVLTDSGGIQEETTILGVPCLTLRENTERPITIEQGTNKLIGSSPENIVREILLTLENSPQSSPKVPELWDGKAADRIVKIIKEQLSKDPSSSLL